MSDDGAGVEVTVTLAALLKALDVVIDPNLRELALTHRSYAYEHGQGPHNERLEFLGDAVLGLVVTDYLYRTFPDMPEGQLAKLRAATVSAASLAEVARRLGVGDLVKLGKGELATNGRDKTSILADTTEALIGAAWLTSQDGARRLVRHVFAPLVDHAATLGAGLDWKTSLQELAAELGLGVPEYVIAESGPDHDKHFSAWVRLDECDYPRGEGHSKKHAEQWAARFAYQSLAPDTAS
ncbi:MAG: ribonuclease III [Propionibacteriaceae bacterium]|nr:ribonuclease III [Propionibacteriaceae bacterium]